jgi:tetratricopeptide (TPR) repeat protein
MKRKTVAWAFAGLSAAAICAGCASRPAADQIKFGVWASKQDLWDEAIFRWQRAVRDAPRSAAAHNNLAVAYELKGRFDDALAEYALALKLDPKNESVKSNYSACKENLAPPKNPEEAKKADEKKK